MIHKNIKKLISLSLLVLILPLFTIQVNGETLNPVNTTFTTQSVEVFVENFTTDALEDAGATNAYGWGSGALTNSKNLSMTALDFEPSLNPVKSIDVQGRKVYAVQYNPSTSTESLNIYSINDPSNIYRTGFRDSMQEQISIAVSGDYIFAGRGGTLPVMASYTYTDPFGAGIWHGNYGISGDPTDIEINGYFVYFTVFNSTSGYSLRVLNAENPALYNNVLPASWSATNYSKGLAIDGNTAYVAAHTDGFYIVDVSNQYSFSTIGWCDTPGNATDVVVKGNYAYVTDGYEGVQIIDISNPAAPVLVANYNTIGYAQKLVLQGNSLFVADGLGGIAMVDVANPEHPVFIPPWFFLPYTYDIDLYGGYVVVGTEAGIHTFRCGPGITKIQNEVFANPFDLYNVSDVRVKGDIAICVGGSNGIFTLDVSDPNNPILLDQHVEGAPANYRKLDVQGNYAYVADYGSGGGIRAYDITDPSNIVYADVVGLTYATDVALYGDIAFVADGTAGVYVMNVTDPYDMVYWCSFTDIFNNVTAIDVEGAKLYVVDENGGTVTNCFYVFDITDIDIEVQLGVDSVDAYFYDVFVDGDVVYTSDENWMLPYNVTDPTNPYYTLGYTHGESFGCWGFGPYVLSADSYEGVSLCDLTDMSALDPRISVFTNATAAYQITTSGDYTYIANTSNLIILRHFESLADTYVDGVSTATSLEIDAMPAGEIYTATLTPDDYIPPGTFIDYYMSADGGANWEAVTPGVEHVFTNIGDDLRWRVDIGGPKYASPHIYEITIDYTYNAQPDTPTLNAIGDQSIGMFKVSWDAVNDDGVIDHYVLQMSDSGTFTEILKEWTPSKTEKFVMVSKGTLSFRVQAVDDEGMASEFSFIETITVSMSSGLLMGIIGGGAAVLILAIVIPVVLVSRKKKMATR